MIDGRLFTLVDEVCREARCDDRPFGGLQIVAVGDMAQLPPVEHEQHGFAFESPSWSKARIRVCELTEVKRQADEKFVAMLNEIRAGRLSDEGEALLAGRVGALDPDVSGAVRLSTHNEYVEQVNERKLGELPGRARSYAAFDFAGSARGRDWIDRNCPSPARLELKVGARVAFTKNASTTSPVTYANGTLATISSLSAHEIWVRTDDGTTFRVEQVSWELLGDREEVVASRRQYPLRLAWAMTVHRSQGLTLDKVSLDLEHAFAAGQTYVALSRVRALEGLNIERWGGRRSIFSHPKVRAFLETRRAS